MDNFSTPAINPAMSKIGLGTADSTKIVKKPFLRIQLSNLA
jgi:hypothetical protein